jgi:iron-sulfur cluster assembly protein
MRIAHRVSPMLQISDEAVDALKELGAIRITAEEAGEELELSIENAESPAEGDQVVERDGARVFLDSAAAEALDDQVLGIHSHGDHFHFTFDEQQASEA